MHDILSSRKITEIFWSCKTDCVSRKNRDTLGRRIAQAIIAEYKPQSVTEMQSALKEVFGSMFEAIRNRLLWQDSQNVAEWDASDIENKVPAIYARGMSQRDIYGFKLSAEQSKAKFMLSLLRIFNW